MLVGFGGPLGCGAESNAPPLDPSVRVPAAGSPFPRGTGAEPASNLCDYPEGPSGADVGDVLARDVGWDGFAEDSLEWSTVTPADYLDCDGSQAINALSIHLASLACVPSLLELEEAEVTAAAEARQGIRTLFIVLDDLDGNPDVITELGAARARYGENYALTQDPARTLALATDDAYPVHIVVDPRNMKVVARRAGVVGDYRELADLARRNGADGAGE